MSLILCVGFFEQLIVTLFFVLLIDILPEEFTGTGAGLMNAIGHIGSMFAMVFTGLIADRFHSYKPVFLILSLLACTGIVATLFIRESKYKGLSLNPR